MSKIAVVYWSGTGNTEAMAKMVANGVKEVGAEVKIYQAGDFSPDMMDDFDAVAFGCPSMGDEELEETEFEPMFTNCHPKLAGKKLALFGSYGWGDGQWMESWEKLCREKGGVLAGDSVICIEDPDSEAEAACVNLGKSLAA
ncbi:MAG: flavodoxin [Bacillota bacterium]|nr:flavodoxin [Bacillota bacterium]